MTEKYRPANQCEAMQFAAKYCNRCKKDDYDGTPETGCDIQAKTLYMDPRIHPAYPAEWTYDEAGSPICTAFDPEDESK